MKRTIAVLGLFAAGLLTSPGQAAEFSFSAGPQREIFSGWVKYKGNEVDVKDDLNISDKTKLFLSFEVKHDIKFLPDVKVDYIRVKTSGTGKISKDITFGDVTFNVSDRIHTDFKADQIDATFFYNPVKKNRINLQVGLGVKYLTGYVKLKSLTTGAYSDTDYDIPVPYLYTAVCSKFSLFRIGLEGKGLAYAGNYFYDWKLKGGVEYGNFFAHVGYRYERLKIDDIDDFSSDLKIKGVFGEIGVRF